MLKIFIGPSKEPIQTANGKGMTVLSAVIEQEGRYVPLNEVPSFAYVNDIELIVRTITGERPLQLSHSVKDGMLHFLARYHAKGRTIIDCYAFVNFTHHQPRHRCAHLFSYWDVESVEDLYPGTTVFFIDDPERCFRHAAVYLGEGLYVSVYGAGGDLEFSTLEDMARDFGGTPAMAIPKAAA